MRIAASSTSNATAARPARRATGWYSFDANGVHFVGLVNVVDLKGGGMGNLGADSSPGSPTISRTARASTPIVVFAHIPLWTIAPEWGWGTEDGAQALKLLARFGSVTVLNGHIHQLMQKVEGNVTFHTARSTAFPQPAPGTAPSPGPMVVPAGHLRERARRPQRALQPGRDAARHHRHDARRLRRHRHDSLPCLFAALVATAALQTGARRGPPK